MKQKRTFRYFRPGDLAGLEYTLNAMSRGGWQAVKPGRFIQRYARAEGCFVHRFDFCPDHPGSAGEITLNAALEQEGWSLAAQRGGWRLYRKAEETGAEARLPGDRTRIIALFRRRTARLEAVRRWMLVLGTLLLIAGYATELLPVLYATALPMSAALFVTYRIKFMEEGVQT